MATGIRSKAAFLLVVLGASAVATGGAQALQAQPSIAVAPLQVHGNGWASAPPAVGEVAAELLVSEVVTSRRFRVIDATAPLGQAGGAAQTDFIITGSVVRFSMEKKRRGIGGFIPVPFIGAVRSSRTEAIVEITLRLVSATTGEIVAASTGRGTASRKMLAAGGLSLHAASAGGAGFSSSSEDFRDSLLGDALRGAVREAMRLLLAASDRP